MNYEVCLFRKTSKRISHYTDMVYAVDFIKDGLKMTSNLKGKQQMCFLRWKQNETNLLYVIYNYVYGKSDESFGLCFVFRNHYPQNVNYLFAFCGSVVSKIVEEGKILCLDENGNIKYCGGKKGSANTLPYLSKHLDNIRSKFESESCCFSPLPPTYYNNRDQHVIHQLGDTSWTMAEALNYNNIVIVTEEIEDENIYSMRSRILTSDQKLKEQERKIAELEAEIKRQRRTKNDTLNSILGALQFTPSKQQRIVRMRKSLLEAGVRHQKGGNKKERTLALIGSVCLTIAILLYVVYAIFASPQMKFKIYEMFSI